MNQRKLRTNPQAARIAELRDKLRKLSVHEFDDLLRVEYKGPGSADKYNGRVAGLTIIWSDFTAHRNGTVKMIFCDFFMRDGEETFECQEPLRMGEVPKGWDAGVEFIRSIVVGELARLTGKANAVLSRITEIP